jgi:hypothetical protein
MGKADEVDALELAVNRAAEQAVPEANTLLTNAVKTMSVDDAKQILRGGDDSVTQFFKSKTSAPLAERFLPIVRRVTEKSGLAQQYNSLAAQGAAFGLVKTEQATVERYVTQKALDGLYTMIAEEERKIRANPLAAGSDIIKLFEEVSAAGQTVILVTHDPAIAARTGRRVRIVDGLIVDGDGDE